MSDPVRDAAQNWLNALLKGRDGLVKKLQMLDADIDKVKEALAAPPAESTGQGSAPVALRKVE